MINVNNDANNLQLVRFMVIKERSNYFICKDYSNKKYKLIKSNETRKLKTGDDTTQYVKKIGQSLFTDIIVLLTKNEEYELTANRSKTLKELGVTIDDLREKRE
jgi:hypothetical protein